MKRFLTIAIALAGLVLLPAPPDAAAQQVRTPDNPWRIYAVVWRGETQVEVGFRDYLTQRGIPFEMTLRNLDRDRGKAPAFVEEIKQTRPDLVYTWGTGTTLSIVGPRDTDTPEKFVRDIPGVFTLVAYPKEAGIVQDFATPGRSVTGVAFLAPVEAQLNTIRAYRPCTAEEDNSCFRKIAVIYDETAGNSRINVEDLRAAIAESGDLELLELPVPLGEDGKPDPEKLSDTIRRAKREGADVLYMGPDSFLTVHRKEYTELAIQLNLPVFASTEAPLRGARAMFGLVTDYYTLGKLTALQAERVLVEGRRPDSVPVARLARYKLWINQDVMRTLGLYPPMRMITVADFQQSEGG